LIKDKKLIEIGIILLAVAVVLLFIVSPYALESSFSVSIKQAQSEINKTVMVLSPNESESIAIESNKIFLYNSTNPLKVYFNGENITQASSNNLYLLATTSNGTLTVINNYTNPIKFGYAIVGISLLSSYLSILLSFIIGIVGVMVIVYGTIIMLRSRRAKTL
jgi:hypothetical protein